LQQYRTEISSLKAKLEAGNDMLAQQQMAQEDIMQAEKRKVSVTYYPCLSLSRGRTVFIITIASTTARGTDARYGACSYGFKRTVGIL
jgi:hypothetical protein